MVGETIEQRGSHLRIAEDAGPFPKCEVGCDDNRGALVKAADEAKQQLAADLGEWQIAEFIENDEVETCEIIGEPSLSSGETIDQIDRREEAPAHAGADAASSDGDRQVGFSCAGSADQDDVTLLGDEGATGEIAHEPFIDRRLLESEVVDAPGEGQLGGNEPIFAGIRRMVPGSEATFTPFGAFDRAKSPQLSAQEGARG